MTPAEKAEITPEITPTPPDRECYTLPNGECVAEVCSLHGPLSSAACQHRPLHSTERPGLVVCGDCLEVLGDQPSSSTKPESERWTNHRNDHGNCAECHRRWPCDVALAWRHGYSWGLTVRALEQIQADVEASRNVR